MNTFGKIAIPVFLFAITAAGLSYCGGGGGGGTPPPATYTIGGTVTGLSGEIVLMNNKSDELTLDAGSGDSFTFPTALTNGSAYSVNVEVQYAGQICLVSNGSGTVSGANVTNIIVTCGKDLGLVAPLFSTNGADWNDYVVGADIASASDMACNAGSDQACLHGGEVRLLQLPVEVSSCTGITAADVLGAFDWICDDSAAPPVKIISQKLKDDKGLSDLLDFDAAAWKENHVIVYNGANVYGFSTYMGPSDNWWTNPVAANTTGGSLSVAGKIYLVPSDIDSTSYYFSFGSEKIALVAAPGVVIDGPSTGGNVLYASSNNFLWLEGMTLNAAGDDVGVNWQTVKFSVMHDVTAGYADTGTYKSGVLLMGGGNNTLSSITASNNGDYGLSLSGSNNKLKKIVASNNGITGIDINASSGNTMSDVTVSDNVSNGISLGNASGNTLSGVVASNNVYGIELDHATGNTLMGVTGGNGGGVRLVYSDGNILSDIRSYVNLTNSHDNILSVVNASKRDGVTLGSSNNNLLSSITSGNNSLGIHITNSSDNTLMDLTVGGGVRGIWMTASSGNTLSGVTAANNDDAGISIESSSDDNTLSGVAAVNNKYYGIRLYGSDQNTFADVVAADNGSRGFSLFSSSNNYFTGKLKVGNNISSNCGVQGGTNPGLVDTTCANNGSSDATVTTGITLASSFVAKVTTDDESNTSDTEGAATITDLTLPFDWTGFENAYSFWGVNGAGFPATNNRGSLGCSDAAYTNQTDCEANSKTWRGDARIWDWSLLSSDTVIRGVRSLPSGNDTLTHTWSDASTVNILRNAIEIYDDGKGNDNTLCESGEECLYTPNIGSYQGHDNLKYAGSIGTGGAIENVILWNYSTNGY